MTLEQLRIFVAVAEREHVTEAARGLNLTQSAVSAAVSALEARYATRLFDRIGRRIALTQAGRLFLGEARAVLARAAEAEAALADLAGLKRGRLALAASQTVANYWLPPLMHRFRAQHPGVALHLAIGNTESVAAMVLDGTADLGFVEGEVDDPSLAITPVGEDELVLAVSAKLARGKAASGRVTSALLKRLPWVFREPGSGTRAIAEAVLAKHGLPLKALNVVLELPSNESVRAAIEDGAGAAVLSRLVVAGSLEAGTLKALPLPLPRRRYVSLRHKDRRLTRAAEAFEGAIKEEQ